MLNSHADVWLQFASHIWNWKIFIFYNIIFCEFPDLASQEIDFSVFGIHRDQPTVYELRIFLVLSEGLSSFVERYEAQMENEGHVRAQSRASHYRAHSKASARQRLSLKDLLDRDNAQLQAGLKLIQSSE